MNNWVILYKCLNYFIKFQKFPEIYIFLYNKKKHKKIKSFFKQMINQFYNTDMGIFDKRIYLLKIQISTKLQF